MFAGVMLTACGQEPSEAPAPDLENGISAIEDAMTKQNENYPANPNMTDDLRDGSSEDTVATPGDFQRHITMEAAKLQTIPAPPCSKSCRSLLVMKPF